jgi:hypothetical protein
MMWLGGGNPLTYRTVGYGSLTVGVVQVEGSYYSSY